MAEDTNVFSENIPYDAYFKGVFSIREVALQLFQYGLPKSVLRTIDLKSVQIVNETYIDEDLGRLMSDLVYVCNLRNSDKQARICILFEHKSSHPGRPIYPQVGHYLMGIQEVDIKQKRKNFSVTIPIIFYHGEEKWTPRTIKSLYGEVPEGVMCFIPGFEYLVINLQGKRTGDILHMKRFLLLRNIFLVMKKGWDAEFLHKHFGKIVIFAEENISHDALLILFQMTLRLVQLITKLDKNAIMDMTAVLPQPEGAKFRIWVDDILNEGMEKGMEKGILISIQKIILKFPQFSNAEIAEIMDVSAEVVAKTRFELQK